MVLHIVIEMFYNCFVCLKGTDYTSSNENHFVLCKDCYDKHYDTLQSLAQGDALSWMPGKTVVSGHVSWSTKDNVTTLTKLFSKEPVSLKIEKPLCKKKYYGIDCSCGACPPDKRIRI